MSQNSTGDSLHLEIAVDQAPEEVFAAVTDVRAWWNQNVTGGTAEVGDEFTYSDEGGLSCRIRLTQVAPRRKVSWEVVEAHLTEFDDHDEWTGTTMAFEIIPHPDGSTLNFIHHGLTPASMCYDACSHGWEHYITNSLRDLITTGTGRPIPYTDGKDES